MAEQKKKKIKRRFFLCCRKSRYNVCKLGGGWKSYFGVQITQLFRAVVDGAGGWQGRGLAWPCRSQAAAWVCTMLAAEFSNWSRGCMAMPSILRGEKYYLCVLLAVKKGNLWRAVKEVQQNSLLPTSLCFHVQSTSEPPRTIWSSADRRAVPSPSRDLQRPAAPSQKADRSVSDGSVGKAPCEHSLRCPRWTPKGHSCRSQVSPRAPALCPGAESSSSSPGAPLLALNPVRVLFLCLSCVPSPSQGSLNVRVSVNVCECM